MFLLSMYLVSYHRAWNATHCCEELEMLTRRQQIEKDVVLRTDAGHAAYRPHIIRIAHVIPEYEGGTRCRCSQTREDVEESGLTGAVVAENGSNLTLVDSQINAVHCLGLRTFTLVKRFVEVGYPDRFATLHLAHYRLYIAIRLFAWDERIRFAIRRWHLQIFL